MISPNSLTDPTWTVLELSQAAGRSRRWIQILARREGLGQFTGNRLVFKRDEATEILKIVKEGKRGNPNWEKKSE